MPSIHYLSATAVNTDQCTRHLAFCGYAMDYAAQRDQFVCYSPDTVTCVPCVEEWARIYPAAHDMWRTRFPAPVEYQADPAEHPDVTMLRQLQAEAAARWVRRYASDPSVSDMALMWTLHQMTYDQAKELARMALRLHAEEGNRG